MTHEQFLENENKRNEARDKAYKNHLLKMEALTLRQVKAQESSIKELVKLVKKATK